MTILEALASGSTVLAVDNANVNHQYKHKALVKTKRNLNEILKQINLLKKNKKADENKKNAINYSKIF